MIRWLLLCAWIGAGCAFNGDPSAPPDTATDATATAIATAGAIAIKSPPGPHLIILGVAQDGGAPQAGSSTARTLENRRFVSSIAIVDPSSGGRWLIDATPDLPDQLHLLDQRAPRKEDQPVFDGIFLTHAHIGHYTGLMFLGHEVMGARGVPVFAMPNMAAFLRTSGPWSQLVGYKNIEIREMAVGLEVPLGDSMIIKPLVVPHRQEFSEVVGFRIQGPRRSTLFIPDIDSWDEWDAMGVRIEDVIASVDAAFLDGTFFANGELPGRDMTGFPHPFITTSMDRFASLSSTERAKIRFIHLNHSNPALDPNSAEFARVRAAGFGLAVRGEVFEL